MLKYLKINQWRVEYKISRIIREILMIVVVIEYLIAALRRYLYLFGKDQNRKRRKIKRMQENNSLLECLVFQCLKMILLD